MDMINFFALVGFFIMLLIVFLKVLLPKSGPMKQEDLWPEENNVLYEDGLGQKVVNLLAERCGINAKSPANNFELSHALAFICIEQDKVIKLLEDKIKELEGKL